MCAHYGLSGNAPADAAIWLSSIEILVNGRTRCVRLVRRRREADAQAAVYGSKDLREGVEALQVRFARRHSPLDTAPVGVLASFVYLNISTMCQKSIGDGS